MCNVDANPGEMYLFAVQASTSGRQHERMFEDAKLPRGVRGGLHVPTSRMRERGSGDLRGA
jgi:hypothetical protein